METPRRQNLRHRPRRHPFEAQVVETIRRRALGCEGACVLAAFSGGPDSTALVAVLAALRDAGLVAAVVACHVDHGLRPGGAEDAAHCARVCAALGVPFERTAVTVPPGNVQASARRARYAALRAVAGRVRAVRIATGHTRSDQAETVLLRLLRGSGARGLAAIPPRRGALVRPLIDAPREAVLAYLADRGLPHRDDPTNATPRFLRNRVRAELLPAMERLAPGAEARLARAADLLREDDRALERRARALVPAGATEVAVGALRRAAPAVAARAVRRLWRAASGSRRGLGHPHVAAVLAAAGRGAPASAALPLGIEARAAYGLLRLGPAPRGEARVAPRTIERAGRYALPGRGVLTVTCDGEPPPWPLALRHRLPGDRFAPAGGRGSKSLKKWLIDAKVPRASRDGLLVLAVAQRVLYVVDLGVRAAGAGALEARLTPEGG
jgi:tRNA(Ile)-lysidine synthase